MTNEPKPRLFIPVIFHDEKDQRLRRFEKEVHEQLARLDERVRELERTEDDGK